jgi:hypothetical protein
MTEKEIVNGFCDMVMKRRAANKIIPNVFIGNYEADIFEITKAGYTSEYEVKISKADFKSDANKNNGYYSNAETGFKHKINYKKDELARGDRVNYFYYIVPEGLINKEDLPNYAGLIYVKKITTTYYTHSKGYYDKELLVYNIIVSAPKLSNEKINQNQFLKCMESCYYRFHAFRNKITKT